MNYLDIIASTIEANNNRDAALKTVENNLKKLQKIVDNVNA